MTQASEVHYTMGRLFALGEAVPPDQMAAEEHYRIAAAGGHAPAQAELGLLLFAEGRRDDALVWLLKAAAQCDARAFYMLGVASFNGDLIPRDIGRAKLLLSAAADAGIDQATVALQRVAALETMHTPAILSDTASAALRERLAMVAALSAADAVDPIHSLVEPMVRDLLSERLESLLTAAVVRHVEERMDSPAVTPVQPDNKGSSRR